VEITAGFSGICIFGADYHQQYLKKNPNGYCGIGGCGVPFKLAEFLVGEKA
jgi:peptide methionine sulfoxide reductase MsrA